MTSRAARILATCLVLLGFPLDGAISGAAAREPAGPIVLDEEPGAVRSLVGSYLAGRFARGSHDSLAASKFYKRALERDPGNEALLKQAFITELSVGNWTRASGLADELVRLEGNHRLARLYLGVREFRAGAFDKAEAHFVAASTGPIGELTGALARAWAHAARGDAKAALDTLDAMKQADWAQQYQRLHRAMIADVLGRRQLARQTYDKIMETEIRALRPVLAFAAHAAEAGNPEAAKRTLTRHLEATPPGHPLARALLADITVGSAVSLIVASPDQGLAEVFYGLGEVLASEGGIDIGTIYLQLSLLLRPDAPLALAALANVYETTKQYERALETYDKIARSSPINSNVEIRKAFNLNLLDRIEEAKALLERQARDEPAEVRPLDALGNIMRSHKRFAEAAEYYSRAIQLIDKPTKAHWNHFYSRGVCYERLKNWPAAEADLTKALELSPDQPLVLNYLGYSWVDQGRNLKQALGYIAKAVKLKPDDGYFVDSLGWAYYRLGDYKQAVTYLERAVELRPEDPTINDHLGDAFFRVGRTLEARYQWEQALTLKPEPEEIEKIKRKIEEGLAPLRTSITAPPRKRKEVRRPEPRQKRVETNDPSFRPF